MFGFQTILKSVTYFFRDIPAEEPLDTGPVTIAQATSERSRLNRRIHLVSGTDAAREFARYRKHICKQAQVDQRDVGYVAVSFEGRNFLEPADALCLMHRWLDDHNVPTLKSR